MNYKVIGLMSGSSLDGLDIAYTEFNEVGGLWDYKILNAQTISYDELLIQKLKNWDQLTIPQFLELHTKYGRWIGQQVQKFIQDNNLEHKVHFIASHGHTTHHNPSEQTSFQIGDGASIASITQLPVITDLRSMDVALGGQGAPIVPVGEQYLFNNYKFLLNIGGIANISIKNENNSIVAFDVCTANQGLNFFAQQLGHEYDADGGLASIGNVCYDTLEKLNQQSYFEQSFPKSLSNKHAMALIDFLVQKNLSPQDALATMVEHIATQIDFVLPHQDESAQLLITGGGAFNQFLVQKIADKIAQKNITVNVPNDLDVQYKEAMIMAFIGVLRWREEENVLHTVTGATRNSIGGALWMGLS